jgi:hypothetical protein
VRSTRRDEEYKYGGKTAVKHKAVLRTCLHFKKSELSALVFI